MTEDERDEIIRRETEKVHERLRPILEHRQGSALDPLAHHLAFATDVSRIEALQIIAAARGCLESMVDAEIERRAQIDANILQALTERAERTSH